ncbi:MAG: tetratricopeptide repeat protein [Deltaproteobacteria bacterium]|nr:tetratricopeptide repeat protein [Deltaproteobacteria bacterium]
MIRPLIVLVPVLVLGASTALAHDPPNHDIEELTERIAAHPSAPLLVERAELWLQEGFADEAASDLRMAATLEPGDAIGRAVLWAEVWRQRGRLDEAEAELDPAVAAGSVEALAARARIRADAGRLTDALADYEAAVARLLTVDLALGHGRTLERLGRPAEAEAVYAVHARRLGNATVLVQARIQVLRQLRRHDDALRAIDTQVRHARAKSTWLLLRGAVLAEAGRTEDAVRAYLAALADAERVYRRRRSVASRLIRAEALAAVGRTAEARAEAERVRAASPQLAARATALLAATEASR